MSFKAKLEMFGKKFDVLHCSYSMRRDVDAKGRPSSTVQGGTVQLEVESTEDTSILASMLNVHKGEKGKITFLKRDEDAKMKALEVEDAYVIQYSESIDSVGSNPMTINFVLSARVISVEGVTLKNEWPGRA